MSDGYLQGLLHRLWNNAPQDRVIMLNQKFTAQDGDPPVLYARAVVETVKIGLKRFRTVLGRNTIANVDIITDVNHHNDHPDFMTELRSEEHTSELQSLMRISYAVFCLKQK